MSYLRCSDCGAKALRIATRCPSCGTNFVLRDSNGDRIRYRQCSGCQIYVPGQESHCPWCSTEIKSFRWQPLAAGSAAVLVFGLVTWMGWTVGTSREATPPSNARTEGIPASIRPVLDEPSPVVLPSGSLDPEEGEPSGESTLPNPPEEVAPLPGARMAIAPPAIAPSPATDALRAPEVQPTSAPLTRATDIELPDPLMTTSDRGGGAWVTASPVMDVFVREGPSRDAPILGIVPEATRVMLGDLENGWRRIRTGNLSGWVYEGFFRTASAGFR